MASIHPTPDDSRNSIDSEKARAVSLAVPNREGRFRG